MPVYGYGNILGASGVSKRSGGREMRKECNPAAACFSYACGTEPVLSLVRRRSDRFGLVNSPREAFPNEPERWTGRQATRSGYPDAFDGEGVGGGLSLAQQKGCDVGLEGKQGCHLQTTRYANSRPLWLIGLFLLPELLVTSAVGLERRECLSMGEAEGSSP